MIIGLLDPALFLPRDSKEVQRDFDFVLQICRKHKIELIPFPEYWRDLWSKLALPLEKALSPEAKRPLQELRRLESNIAIPTFQPPAGKVWRRGFEQLFGASAFSQSWEEPMMKAALRALSADHEVILLTRRVDGRNIQRHAASDCTLDEITRWALYLQPKGMGPKQILCVYHPRNLQLKWTVRFDWRLPAVSDGARYPFCPPDKWWRAKTPAHRTIKSKPAWVDKLNNGWARPNTPGLGHHWDVYIESPQLQEAVGLDQINVIEFGVPSTEGKPGHIHHVPGKKQGKLSDTGWKCR